MKKGKIRGMVGGVFDLAHFGHFNMLRQASEICDEVVLVLNSDKSVLEHKGPTIMTVEERKIVV